MNYKERYDALMEEAKKVARPIIHTEFVCPCCGGIASAVVENGAVIAECHACGVKGYGRQMRFEGRTGSYSRRTI